jgi:DNA-binding transcriptional LysR family regulator
LQGLLASLQRTADPPWDDIRLFLALHRARTLAAAAKVTGLDSSTLSRRLAALEDALGTKLFERTRNGLVPTASAEPLLDGAEEMAEAHSRLARDASSLERAAEGRVRLSVPPGMAEAFVAPALARLRRGHPRIQIDLDVSLQFADLTRREADLAIRTRRPQTGDLVSVRLGSRRWVPMVSKREAKRSGVAKAWGALRWITWGDDLVSFPPAIWIAKHVPGTSIVLRTSHIATQVAAVQAGLGAALLPPSYARVGAVVPVRSSAALARSADELPTTETWLVGHRALRLVPRVAAVWSFLVQDFARFEPATRAARQNPRANGIVR